MTYLSDGRVVARALFLHQLSKYYGVRSFFYSLVILPFHWNICPWPSSPCNACLLPLSSGCGALRCAAAHRCRYLILILRSVFLPAQAGMRPFHARHSGSAGLSLHLSADLRAGDAIARRTAGALSHRMWASPHIPRTCCWLPDYGCCWLSL